MNFIGKYLLKGEGGVFQERLNFSWAIAILRGGGTFLRNDAQFLSLPQGVWGGGGGGGGGGDYVSRSYTGMADSVLPTHISK